MDNDTLQPQRYRRFPRLKDYDYSQPGAYFVTICIKDRRNLFGHVVEHDMHLNPIGELVREAWEQLPSSFPGLELDAYVIMPNHVHGIVVIATAPFKHTLGDMVRNFKARTSFYIHASGLKDFQWQQKYWDCVLRHEKHLVHIRQYIANNPAQWTLDQLYQS